LGAVDYVTKPINNNELLARISTHIELRNARQKIEENEEKYRILFEKSNDAILLIDGNKFRDCNLSTVKMLGYKTKSEFLNTHPSKLSPEKQPDGRLSYDKAEEMMALAYEKGIHKFEWIHKRANGEDFPVEVWLTAIPFQNKRIMHTVWRDLTERKNTEQKIKNNNKELKSLNELIQEKEQRLKTIIKNQGEGFGIVDSEENFTFVNPAAEEIFGVPENTLMGRNLKDFFDKEQFIKIKQETEKRKTGKSSTYELTLIRPDKQKKVILLTATPDYNRTRNHEGTIGIFRDITLRKEAENALKNINITLEQKVEERTVELKQSEKKFRDLFNRNPASLWEEDFSEVVKLLDAKKKDGITDFIKYFNDNPDFVYECVSKIKVLNVNQASLGIYKAPSKEYLINNFAKTFSEKSIELFKRNLVGIPEEKYNFSEETELLNCKGEVFSAIVHAIVIENSKRILVSITDISQLKETENALRDSEERLRSIFENMQDVYYKLDTNGKILTVSPSAVELYKYNSLDEIIGKQASDFIYNVQDNEKLIEKLQEKGYIKNYIIKHKCKDGEPIFVETNTNLVFNDQGIPEGAVGVFRDITERILAEEALKFSETNLSAAQQLAHIGSFEHNLINDGVYWSDETYNIYDLDRNTTPSMKIIIETVYPDDKVLLKNSISKLIKGKTVEPVEFMIITAKGKEKYIRSIINLISDENGNPAKIVGTIQDITQQKKIENELKKLNTAVEQSANIVIITNKKGIIEYVNKKFTESTGYSKKEAVGKNPNILKSGKQSKTFYKNMWDTINSGKKWSNEIHNKKKNGELYWESTTISPIFNDKREITNFIAIKEDITEQKLMKQKISNAIIKAEEEERGRLAKDLHDGLGPLLSAAKLYIESLKYNTNKKHNKETFDKFNELIDESIISAREIANNLSPHILKNFGLIAAIKALSNKILVSENLNINIRSKLDIRIDENIEIVAYRLIAELINNTLKHAKASTIDIDIDIDNNDLLINYADNGIGFNVKKALTIPSGLGFSNIVNRIEILNGKFDINSHPNKGSVFKINIPIKL